MTVVFNGAEGRDMYIVQGGKKLATGYGSGADVSFSAETDDVSQPVYVYGGSSNKNLYAIIVEYYGAGKTEAVAEPMIVQETKWLGMDTYLVRESDGSTNIKRSTTGDIAVSLDTAAFAETDKSYSGEELVVNSIAEYNGRLYAGCDGGYVMIFTECEKCSRLVRLSDHDIKELSIENGRLILSSGDTELSYALSDIGADAVTAEEASVMIAAGAIAIDVRGAEEYATACAPDTVNIPLDALEAELDGFDKNTALIFMCAGGTRAAEAVQIAKAHGFERAFSLGSFESLM